MRQADSPTKFERSIEVSLSRSILLICFYKYIVRFFAIAITLIPIIGCAGGITGQVSGVEQYGTTWGTNGDGDGQFEYPSSVAVAPDGTVYVSDNGNHRIQKFTSERVFVDKWGKFGSGSGKFRYPHGVTVASDFSVYVADTGNHRIEEVVAMGTDLVERARA